MYSFNLNRYKINIISKTTTAFGKKNTKTNCLSLYRFYYKNTNNHK
jgi:hypothetical protein